MKLLIGILLFALVFLGASNSLATEKLIALTFDDGPRPNVLKNLLPLLQKYSAPATFFIIGAEILPNDKFVKKMSENSYEIENHSWGHENLVKLLREKGADAVKLNLEKTNSEVFKITGRKPKFFRPPYWEINADVEKVVRDFGLTPMKLGNPDINTMDYDDYAKKRSPEALIERVKKIILSRENREEYRHVLVFHELPITVEALKTLIPYLTGRGYSFGTLDDFFSRDKRRTGYYKIKLAGLATDFVTPKADFAQPKAGNLGQASVKSVYLSVDNLYNHEKINYIFSLFDGTELNAIVIDFKVDKPQINQYVKDLVARFHQKGIYVIGRLVMFQDSYLARARPHLAIRNKNGDMCFSGRKTWQRYWVDMASDEVLNYNIEIAKRGIDMGFDEINFDYIRFPSDLSNCNLKNNISYPVWKGYDKYQTMRRVFAVINRELKDYSIKNNTRAILSIDIFGEVFAYGSEPGIGQKLSDIAEFFDVISPMAYPSHYKCQEFGLPDPNANPYVVYNRTLKPGLKYLRSIGFMGEVRPWIQDFKIANIYGCGPVVYYGPREVKAQIKASEDLGINGFMLWNAANNYTKRALSQ